MYRSVETFPPAKLNLFLEVLGKRNDGFHDLDTVMIGIDLRDSLRIERTEEPSISLECRWMPSVACWQNRLQGGDLRMLQLPAPEQNLVYRSLDRFRQVFSLSCGFRVRLDKHIPAGAGMGGASSDAASALRCAATLCGIPMECPDLLELAAEMGSDMPFFCGQSSISLNGNLHPTMAKAVASECSVPPADLVSANNSRPQGTGFARARGRGEQIEVFAPASTLHFVIVYPPMGLSTADVYRNCSWESEPQNSERILSALANRANFKKLLPRLFNRLTEPARRLSTWIDRTLEAIQHVGLNHATMTGSGSACFAVAPSATVARRAANRLAGAGVGACFAAKSVCLPTPIRFVT